MHSIREQWFTNVRVDGIPYYFIEQCVQSYNTICNALRPFWDEVVKVPLEKLQDTLNNICAKHIVIRRVKSKRQTTSTLVTDYYCHRGWESKNSKRERRNEFYPARE